MTRKLFFIITLFFLSTSLFAQYPKLTDDAKVTLFTCGPGEELYAGFGHSALWISDPAIGVDRLYNYGTFDFSTPHFYWKFIRGKLNYMISVTRANRFLEEYDYRKISVYEQLLDLNEKEKQQLFEFLENNLLPENRFYKYDFFYDNCATRIRDVLVKICDGEVHFNTSDKNLTFRKMLFPYLTHTPWTKFGINMILGLTADKKATPWDYMYLPEYMQEEFQNATIAEKGVERKLVTHQTEYFKSRLNFTNRKIDDPVVIFSALLLITLMLTFYEIKKKVIYNWLNYVLFIISCLAGLFLLFMWLGTDHIATNKNMNILWLLPAQLLFLISMHLHNNKWQKRINITALTYQFLISFILLVWLQETEISFTLLSLIFVVRTGGYVIIKNRLHSKR